MRPGDERGAGALTRGGVRLDLIVVKDRPLWDRVQARLAAARPLGTPKRRQGRRTSVVSGLIRCGNCGGD